MAADAPNTERCHCGRELHYSSKFLESMMRAIVLDLGEYVPVIVDGRTWLVQRHYAALHGIVAAELPVLGFKEVTA